MPSVKMLKTELSNSHEVIPLLHQEHTLKTQRVLSM